MSKESDSINTSGYAAAIPVNAPGNPQALAAASPASQIVWEMPSKRIIFGFLAGWAVFFLVLMLPPPAGMKPAAMRTLAVVSWAVIIWVTEAVPVGVTGLIIPMLLFVTKALPKLPQAFGGFTAHTTYLCLGAFLFAAMMQLCGLDRRISIMCLNLFKVQKVDQLIRAMFLNNFILAVLIPATAARGATLLPIMKGFLDVFKDTGEDAKANMVIQCMIYSTLFCGVVVMTAHMPNIIMINLFEKKLGVSIGYLQWFWLHMPMLFLWVPIYYWTRYYFKTKGVTIPGGLERVRALKEEMGQASRVEWLLLILFGITAVTWAVGKQVLHLPLGIITIMILCIFFIPGLLPWKWKVIQKNTTWGTFLFLAGAMSLSVAMSKTGLAAYLANLAKPIAINQYWMVTLLILMVTTHIIRLGMLSNVAAIAFLAPVMLDLAPIYNLNAVPFTLLICDIDTFAYIIPTQLTIAVLATSLGAFKMKDYAIVGLGTMVMAIAFDILVMAPWYAYNGFPLLK
jgi:sodium-dependent dicarboxylate transporter 2/3/5